MENAVTEEHTVTAFISPHWCLDKTNYNRKPWLLLQGLSPIAPKRLHKPTRTSYGEENWGTGRQNSLDVQWVSALAPHQRLPRWNCPKSQEGTGGSLQQPKAGNPGHCHPGKLSLFIPMEIMTWNLKWKSHTSHLYNQSSRAEDHHLRMEHAADTAILIYW